MSNKLEQEIIKILKISKEPLTSNQLYSQYPSIQSLTQNKPNPKNRAREVKRVCNLLTLNKILINTKRTDGKGTGPYTIASTFTGKIPTKSPKKTSPSKVKIVPTKTPITKSTITPYKWQETAPLEWDKVNRHGIIQGVPGSGKTQAGVEIIKFITKENPSSKTLILCPTRQILEQWKNYIASNNLDKFDITTATYFKAVNCTQEFDLIIYDESHSLMSEKRNKVLKIKTKYKLGLSATPMDSDKFVGPIFIKIPWKEANVSPFDVKLEYFNLSPDEAASYRKHTHKVSKALKLYDADQMSREIFMTIIMKRRSFVYTLPRRIQLTIDLLKKYKNQRIIIFSERLSQIEQLKKSIRHNLKVPFSVHTSKEDTISDYINKKTNILITSKMIKEGFDDPSTHIGILVSTPLSHRNHIQTLGRIVRAYPNKNAEIHIILASGTTDENLKQHAPSTTFNYGIDKAGNIYKQDFGKHIYATNPLPKLKDLLKQHIGKFFINDEGKVGIFTNNEWKLKGLYTGDKPQFPQPKTSKPTTTPQTPPSNTPRLKPTFLVPTTQGEWRMCFENARKEYWKRRNKGEKVEYHMGTVYGYSIFEPENPLKTHVPFSHAWVQLSNNIIDSTPFKEGNTGNTHSEPDILPDKYWREVYYVSAGTVKPSDLKSPLTQFPKPTYFNWKNSHPKTIQALRKSNFNKSQTSKTTNPKTTAFQHF